MSPDHNFILSLGMVIRRQFITVPYFYEKGQEKQWGWSFTVLFPDNSIETFCLSTLQQGEKNGWRCVYPYAKLYWLSGKSSTVAYEPEVVSGIQSLCNVTCVWLERCPRNISFLDQTQAIISQKQPHRSPQLRWNWGSSDVQWPSILFQVFQVNPHLISLLRG